MYSNSNRDDIVSPSAVHEDCVGLLPTQAMIVGVGSSGYAQLTND